MLIETSEVVSPGDSGTLGVCLKDNKAFGMLISSDTNKSALFTPLNTILDKFKVGLVIPGEK